MLTEIVTLRPSAAVTGAQTEIARYEDQSTVASGTTTATTSNKLVDSGAAFSTAAVAIGDIVVNTTDGTFALVSAIDSETQLTIDTDIMASGEDYQIYGGKGYKLQDSYELLVATLDVTAAATAAGDTLNVYLDTSFDGGATWVNIGAFTQVLGNGGAKKYVMSLKAAPVASSNVVSATADQTAGNALQIGFGDRLRARGVTVSGTSAAFTYSVKAFLKK